MSMLHAADSVNLAQIIQLKMSIRNSLCNAISHYKLCYKYYRSKSSGMDFPLEKWFLGFPIGVGPGSWEYRLCLWKHPRVPGRVTLKFRSLCSADGMSRSLFTLHILSFQLTDQSKFYMIKLSYQHKFNFLCNSITLPQVSHRKSVDINEWKMLPDIKVEAASHRWPRIQDLYSHIIWCVLARLTKSKVISIRRK